MGWWLLWGPMAPWGMELCWDDGWIQGNSVRVAVTDLTCSTGTELAISPCASTAAVILWWQSARRALLGHHSFKCLWTAEEPLLGSTCRLKGAPLAYKNKTKTNEQAQSICSPATTNNLTIQLCPAGWCTNVTVHKKMHTWCVPLMYKE